MQIDTLPAGDPVHRDQKCIVVPFAGKRRVLSTCQLNGGYQEGLTAVFNNDVDPGDGTKCRLLAPSYEEHLALTAEMLGLDRHTAAGMSTAASMDNAAIRTERFGSTAVTAVVTAGIEVNGGRVGDPASWDEAAEPEASVKAGTINIMLFISTDMSPGGLARAMVTCTEAKAAALQELLVSSRYSMGIATGSGTDSTIVVCNAESPICLNNAGKHCKLGELIGKAVKAAVKEALYLQTGLSPEKQHHILRRTERLGITEESLWEDFLKQNQERSIRREDFAEQMYKIGQRDELVAAVSLYVHLLDQLLWGMLSPQEAYGMGQKILEMMMPERKNAGSGEPSKGRETEEDAGAAGIREKEQVLTVMIQQLKRRLNGFISIK